MRYLVVFIGWALWRYEQYCIARIRRRCEDATMREFGVSRPFVQAVLANGERLATDQITQMQWLETSLAITKQYPGDAAMLDQHAEYIPQEKI